MLLSLVMFGSLYTILTYGASPVLGDGGEASFPGKGQVIFFQVLFCASILFAAWILYTELVPFPRRWSRIIESYATRGTDADGVIVGRREAEVESSKYFYVTIEYDASFQGAQTESESKKVVRRELLVAQSTYNTKGTLPLLVLPNFPESALPKNEVAAEAEKLSQKHSLTNLLFPFVAWAEVLLSHAIIIIIFVIALDYWNQNSLLLFIVVITLGDVISFYLSYIISEKEHKARIRKALGEKLPSSNGTDDNIIIGENMFYGSV